jgi:cation:H+ antiporter
VTYVLLAASFALIVGGAALFTNAVEWLGRRLDLGHGAVGSILAAVGTALPESTIPIIAVLAGAEGEDVAIGAIIGAPFMLATVAMLLIAGSALLFRERRDEGRAVRADTTTVRRDIGFFLPAFALALALGHVDSKPVHIAGAAVLVIVYAVYVRMTLHGGQGSDDEGEELKPLRFDTSKDDPPETWQIVAQLVFALALIIGGAELFVQEITTVAEEAGVSALVLALIIAPLATELPEKINSIIWMRRSKDQLAVGNVTGAMAFQATIPVALGLIVTDWALDRFATAAGVIALAGGGLALWRLERQRMGAPAALAWASLFATLIVFVIAGSTS